jgi:hypothetical protein
VGGVLSCVVDHILEEFNTLFLTRFRTYKIATPPQTKMTNKDDMVYTFLGLRGVAEPPPPPELRRGEGAGRLYPAHLSAIPSRSLSSHLLLAPDCFQSSGPRQLYSVYDMCVPATALPSIGWTNQLMLSQLAASAALCANHHTFRPLISFVRIKAFTHLLCKNKGHFLTI